METERIFGGGSEARTNENIGRRISSALENYGSAFLVYLALALLMFMQITLHITNVANGSGGDVFQNLWDIWWVRYALLNLHTGIFNTTLIFWPIGTNLIYQAFSPVGSLLSIPFQAVSVPFAFNVMFFLGFALSGITMYILAEYLTKNRYAAFLAGIFFAFSAFHIAQSFGRINLINIEWVPLAVYFFLRIIREDRGHWYYDSLGLGISFMLVSFMGDFEQSIMVMLLLVMMTVIMAIDNSTRGKILNKRFFLAIFASIAVAFITGIWGFLPLVYTLAHGGVAAANSLNNIQHNEIWSDNIVSFLVPSYFDGIFNGISKYYYNVIYAPDVTERVSYIGYTVIALIIYGMYRNNNEDIKIWGIVGIIFVLLALGPYVQIWSDITSIPSLFYIYHLIPVINIIREPGRFDLIVTMATSIMAAFGAKAVMERAGKTKLNNKYVITAVIMGLFLIESNGVALNHTLASSISTKITVPNVYTQLGNLNGNFSVLPLPVLPAPTSAQPELYPAEEMYYTSVSHKPIIGGYAGRESTKDLLSIYNIPLAIQTYNLQTSGNFSYQSPIDENTTNMTLMTLYNYNTGFVVLEKGAFNNQTLGTLTAQLYGIFGTPVYNGNNTTAFQTSNAISRSLYRSFVSYPLQPGWNESYTVYNGSVVDLWVPFNGGRVLVFAPYKNSTGIPTNSSYVNATVSFEAISGGNSTLNIGIGSGSSISRVAAFNVTDVMKEYTTTLRMKSGPAGNELFFIPSASSQLQQTQVIGIRNITISG